MHATDRITQSIAVDNFDRIALHVNNVENEVVIKQGDHESLTIEAAPDIVARIKTEIQSGRLNVQLGGNWTEKISAALATSLTRPRIKFAFTVKHLTDLEITGLAHVDVTRLETDHLTVHFSGIGDLNITELQAKRLDIEQPLPGACRIDASGHVTEQHISLRGMSDYCADELDSKRASVALKGPGGHAVIRAADELDVTISGPGRVEYYGSPRVKQKVSPLGVVNRVTHS